jgi:uncharacterized Zn-binding protein involved in type VI secretion
MASYARAVTKPLAKEGDEVVAIDTHIVMVTSPSGPVPTPLPAPFRGPLDAGLSSTVFADDKPAATVDSKASTTPHVPQGGPFQRSPAHEGTVERGSGTVFIDDKAAARQGDSVVTCNDPRDRSVGRVLASGTVLAGD